jgi:hypothetical protein
MFKNKVALAFFIITIQIYGFAFLSQNIQGAQMQWNVIDTITQLTGFYQAYHCFSTGKCVISGVLLLVGATWIIYNHWANVPFTNNAWKIPSILIILAWGSVALIHLK